MLTYNLSVKKILSSCSLDPEWQRNSNLWPTPVVNQYLDDVIDGNPMAPILVFKDKKLKKRVVIDGKQRISNLMAYLKHPDTPAEEKDRIQKYEFAVVEYQNSYFEKDNAKKGDLLDIQKVVDFFHKTNSAGVQLNAQEVRRAVNLNKPYIKFVKKVRFTETFEDFLSLFSVNETEIDRMQLRFLDEEFILKTMAYHYIDNFSLSPYAGKLIETSVAIQKRQVLEEDFEHIFRSFINLYSNEELKDVRFAAKYKGIMPLIVGVITQYDKKELKNHKKAIVAFLEDFWSLTSLEIAQKHCLTFNSGSGFYRAISNLIINRMDDI